LSFAEASDRVSTVLGMYKCSSEKQVQREKNTAANLYGIAYCSQATNLYIMLLYWIL